MPFLAVCVCLLFIAIFLFLSRKRDGSVDLSDVHVQLGLVKNERFRSKPILNISETIVFYNLKDAIEQHYPRKYLLFAQVPLGAFLVCKDDNARKSINSKRVDFLVTNTKGQPVLVIEYQGSGHYQGTAHIKDEIKRTAFESAGVNFYEIEANTSAHEYQKKMINIIELEKDSEKAH